MFIIHVIIATTSSASAVVVSFVSLALCVCGYCSHSICAHGEKWVRAIAAGISYLHLLLFDNLLHCWASNFEMQFSCLRFPHTHTHTPYFAALSASTLCSQHTNEIATPIEINEYYFISRLIFVKLHLNWCVCELVYGRRLSDIKNHWDVLEHIWTRSITLSRSLATTNWQKFLCEHIFRTFFLYEIENAFIPFASLIKCHFIGLVYLFANSIISHTGCGYILSAI